MLSVPSERSLPARALEVLKLEKAYPLDLLPFGGVERPPNKIVWPPELSIVMNVAGYREALAAAQDVEVATDFVVPVASLPGLAILKLLAWADRGIENPKDAVDLVTLLRWYGAAGNEDRLYGEEMSLLEGLGYNMDLAGPQLLGKDAARITATETRNQVLALLDGWRPWSVLLETWHGRSVAPKILSARPRLSSRNSRRACRRHHTPR